MNREFYEYIMKLERRSWIVQRTYTKICIWPPRAGTRRHWRMTATIRTGKAISARVRRGNWKVSTEIVRQDQRKYARDPNRSSRSLATVNRLFLHVILTANQRIKVSLSGFSEVREACDTCVSRKRQVYRYYRIFSLFKNSIYPLEMCDREFWLSETYYLLKTKKMASELFQQKRFAQLLEK